jgi:hypothetical protein
LGTRQVQNYELLALARESQPLAHTNAGACRGALLQFI